MAQAHAFKRALARTIEVTGGPRVELTTLADAARFVALLRPFRQARPHWDFAAELLLKAGETGKRRDVEAATAQMERALGDEGWFHGPPDRVEKMEGGRTGPPSFALNAVLR